MTTEAKVFHVLVRSRGPMLYGETGEPALPAWPDGATPALLDEYQVHAMPVERAGEARRVLAACLKCCWHDLAGDPWPGDPAPVELVLDTYRTLIGRSDDLMRNWAIGALRRLHDSAWIMLGGHLVRLGPRCALWPTDSHTQLRELMRRLPETPPSPANTPSAPGVATTTLPILTEDTAEPPMTADGATGGDGFSPGVPLPGHSPMATDIADRSIEIFICPAASGESGQDDDLLQAFDERRRAELVAAFMTIEHAAEPVPEARFAALRDPALRRTLADMLHRRGRTLIQTRERWISGYCDDVVDMVRSSLGTAERAVLVLVLVHSVAIPRAEGLLAADTWLSPYPAPAEELRRHSQLPIGELEAALRTLRHAGLVALVKSGKEDVGGYIPGPQFHRLTAAARQRLQEDLILAAGPHTPLAVAIRTKRKITGNRGAGE